MASCIMHSVWHTRPDTTANSGYTKDAAVLYSSRSLNLLREPRRAFSRTFDYQAYLWAALLYLLIVELLRNVWAWLEARLTRHLKR